MQSDMAELDPNSLAILTAVTGRITAAAKAGDSAIDLACGEGRILRELKKSGFENLVGLGYQITAAIPARLVSGIDLCKEGWASELAREKFDWIVCTEVIEHLTNPYLFLTEARKLLKD